MQPSCLSTPSLESAPVDPLRARRITAATSLGVVAVASVMLLVHARLFDFICDDAFIALRYARNFAAHGEPIYNTGQRVEGYTSFAWMALVAAGIFVGASAVASAKALGVLSGVLLLGATWRLWGLLEPKLRAVGALVLAGVVLSAPVAAWTLGGLETPLFAALVVVSIALGARAAAEGGTRAGLLAGGAVALSTLTRPEGAALFAAMVLVVALATWRRRNARPAVLGLVLAFLGIMVPFVAWRWHYYGALLPNTYYVKTSGHDGERFARGLSYLRLAATEMGVPVVLMLFGSLVMPARASKEPDQASSDVARRAALWMIRLFLIVIVPYVAWIGGDFLDLYRFFVPIVPLLFISIALTFVRLILHKIPPHSQVGAGALAAAVVLAPHAGHQIIIGARARMLSEPRREKAGIEPIGWTRLYELRWAASGRWIAAHSEPDDWMATGAAGAMPFYAEISNLDILGLNDAFIAREGKQQGIRPGHQRESPEWYTLSKQPVFLFIDDAMTEEHKDPKRDEGWEAKGYFWVEARVDERYGIEKPYFHRFLMRTDRAVKLMGTPDFIAALGKP